MMRRQTRDQVLLLLALAVSIDGLWGFVWAFLLATVLQEVLPFKPDEFGRAVKRVPRESLRIPGSGQA